jgi:hypothetical protein
MKQKIQVVLLASMIVAGLRLAYILYDRHQSRLQDANKALPPAPVNPDYLVSPKKLRPYDLKSAGELTQQPVWVKVGYSITYFPYDVTTRHADFAHEAGLLLPIERLEIKRVVTDFFPKAPGERQVMAVFVKNGKTYAFSIGVLKGEEFQIYSDDMLFVEDPHELYKHWPKPVWDSIDKHEVKPGMNEIQANFAIGIGVPEGSGDGVDRTLTYPNGGKPLSVTYRDGKVADVKSGAGGLSGLNRGRTRIITNKSAKHT